MTPTFTVDLGKKCAECGKGGAAPNGLCLSCVNRAIRGKPMRSSAGRDVQQHWHTVVASANAREKNQG